MTVLFNLKMIGKIDFGKLKTYVKNFLFITIIVVVGSCNPKEDKAQTITKYAMGIVFRETPYAAIQGAKIVDKEQVEKVKHFEFDYDEKGRLVEFRYVLKGKLIPFSDRFVRAPKVKISHEDSLEIRTFFNEYGHRTLVSGRVYETRIKRNKKGERTTLTFYGLDGKPIENDFGIVKYHWVKDSNGHIIESRYNLKDELVRNRPEFQYMVTRFSFDGKMMLKEMTNLGLDGKHPTPDESGTVSTRITYDADGRFTEWANFDIDGNLIRGMTNIAKIIYRPSPYFSEQEALFIGKNDLPQHTNWGVHKVVYEFDDYGNEINRVYRDTLNKPTNSNSGLGMVKSTYTTDGMYLQRVSYYNKKGEPIGFGDNKIHGTKVNFDDKGRPVKTSFYNLDGIVANSWYGYATETTVFDDQGRIKSKMYLDAKGKLANNQEIGIARLEYIYTNGIELEAVQTYDAEGKEKQAQWNPGH